MLEQLEQNPELLASKVKAAREAEQKDAAIQKAEKRDFDLFQSSREIDSALGMQRWGSNIKPPIGKIPALMNQARKQGLIKPLDSNLTSSSNQSKICSDRDILTPKKSVAYSTDTEAVKTSSSMEIGMVPSAGLTTVQDSLGFAPTTPTTPIPQQIVLPITTTPNPDPTSFYEYLLYILMFSKPC
jgi:flagellar hook-length control protein FliK